MLQIKIFPVNPLAANCLVLWEDTGKACVIADPGFYRPDEEDMVFNFLRNNGLTPDAVLLTHAHFDHCWAAADVAGRFGCPVFMSAADDLVLHGCAEMLERLQLDKSVEPFRYQDITDGEILHAGGTGWKVITTPGHSPGSVVFYCQQEHIAFTGDTLFRMSVGRTDFQGGSHEALMDSLHNVLAKLPPETVILPGHGPQSTISEEMKYNPYMTW